MFGLDFSNKQAFAISLFVAMGGMALVWKYAAKYIPALVDSLVEKLLLIPRVRAFVKANAKQIITIMDSIFVLIKEDINQVEHEDDAPSSVPPQASTPSSES